MEDLIRYKAFSILKQPAFRISDMIKKTYDYDISSDLIRIILDYIKSFCKKVYMNNAMIFFIIDYTKNGENSNFILYPSIMDKILSLSTQNYYFHYLDKHGNLLISKKICDINFSGTKIEENDIAYENISAISDLIDSTFVFSYRINYEVYHTGKLIESSYLNGESFIPGKILEKCKPISKYKEIINDHYDDCVKLSQGIDYWHNKGKRILRNSCEDIFKKSLWYYMYIFAYDAIEVTPEFQLPSESRIDILARTSKNDIYIFEVKVLGDYVSLSDQEKFHTYSEERVHEGMLQVKQYIEQIKDLTRGTLVVYDGRNERIQIPIPKDEKHIKLDDPLYLYLESDSATITANKLRKKLKSQSTS